MRNRLTALAACAALVAAPLAGCGGKKAPGIPRGDASELISLLRTAQRQADDPQKCDDLQATVRDLQSKVGNLPSKTDGDVRDSLENGIRNLAQSARSQCAKTDTTPTTPTETTPSVPTTPPPTTDVTPTPPPQTTPPQTTPPQTVPPAPTTPAPATPTTPGTGGSSPGKGNGKGNGKGKKDKGRK